MMRKRLHLGWVLAISCWLLAISCSSDESGEKQPTTLTVYVYSPEHPMLMRAGIGPVNPTEAERQVNKLQIWVFESGTGKKVGYLETTETSLLNTSEGATFQMIVDDAFAQYKPDVDVYVLANVKVDNCGYSFNESSTREYIRENAKLTTSYFGLSPLTSSVPPAGLPMVGVLKDQPVVGDAPVLRVGTQSHITNVSLERAVSKVRFVFANTTNAPILTIKNIQLKAGMIPNEEYLIPQSRELTYNSSVASLLSSPVSPVKSVANPTIYIYDGQEAQTYETLIDQANLTTVGPYYLRESEKQLEGTITYTIGEGEDKVGTFKMNAAGDFSRNRSWIVYAYHAGGSFLELNAMYVKDWSNKEIDHEVYNW